MGFKPITYGLEGRCSVLLSYEGWRLLLSSQMAEARNTIKIGICLCKGTHKKTNRKPC